MKKLLKKLGSYTLTDAFLIEKSDRQFQALKKLHSSLKNDALFLKLALTNATVGYMLSSSGEDYWEEFSDYFKDKSDIPHSQIIQEVQLFLPLSKGNKRLNTHKNLRLKKLTGFLDTFEKNILLYQDDMVSFVQSLSAHMNQKSDAKTITFTAKIHNYAVRIIRNTDIVVPFEISIPIVSRLTKLYQLHNTNPKISIKKFYQELSKQTGIPQIHLDGIIWTKFKDFL